jgi:alpha-amylase
MFQKINTKKMKKSSLLLFYSNFKQLFQHKKLLRSNKTPFVWEGANVYFLMTDRFNNGDKSNDLNFDRNKTTGKLRGLKVISKEFLKN